MVFTTICVTHGQKFAEQRTKQKFRPSSEWFINMQPPLEQNPNYFEQSDQPAPDPSNEFLDLYVEDYEPDGDSQFTGGSKFARHPAMEAPVFQPLCPTSRTDVFLNTDSAYEYRPSSYVEVKCEEF